MPPIRPMRCTISSRCRDASENARRAGQSPGDVRMKGTEACNEIASSGVETLRFCTGDSCHDGSMLDSRDIRLLSLLQDDAETPLHLLAECVALSASACSRRIARLKAEGYIAKTVAVL